MKALLEKIAIATKTTQAILSECPCKILLDRNTCWPVILILLLTVRILFKVTTISLSFYFVIAFTLIRYFLIECVEIGFYSFLVPFCED